MKTVTINKENVIEIHSVLVKSGDFPVTFLIREQLASPFWLLALHNEECDVEFEDQESAVKCRVLEVNAEGAGLVRVRLIPLVRN